MRVLTFTNLYPNPAQPRHGIFVEHRVRQLAASGVAAVRVVAPVPWVPKHAPLGRFAALARVPRADERYGISVHHPRFFAIPRITSWLNPLSMAACALPTILRVSREAGDFDLIDAHFVYPDGAAAVMLGAWLDRPVVVTARGTDVNDFHRYPVPRAWIRWVSRRAAALITVSAALRETLLRLSVPPGKITVLRNGVDLELFRPLDRAAVRRELGLTGPTLLSVGHLVEDKGHRLVVEAMKSLPEARLIVVGEGPSGAGLRAFAERCGVAARCRWTGTLSQAALAKYYAAADVTVLASRIEGMPNVLLESLACGTPVIATASGGNAEVVSAPAAGVLLESRDAPSIARAYRKLNAALPHTAAVRAHAEQFGWGPTTQGQLRLFERVLAAAGKRADRADGPADVRG